uniref:ResB-like domain-containing protein n=1 Tax=Ditylenchus dipsaci TaxID=166011 RepID=A0A915EMZ8_9BILA
LRLLNKESSEMSLSVMLRNNVMKSGANWTLAALHLRQNIILRLSSQGHGETNKQKPSHKVEMISDVKGHLIMYSYFVQQASHAYELWPLYGLMTASTLLLIVIFYVSFNRIEIWVDRTAKDAPIAYYRTLDGGTKMKGSKQLFDMTGGKFDERLPIVDKLHREMFVAAKERGTR